MSRSVGSGVRNVMNILCLNLSWELLVESCQFSWSLDVWHTGTIGKYTLGVSTFAQKFTFYMGTMKIFMIFHCSHMKVNFCTNVDTPNIHPSGDKWSQSMQWNVFIGTLNYSPSNYIQVEGYNYAIPTPQRECNGESL
jgi:hypothetical protein